MKKKSEVLTPRVDVTSATLETLEESLEKISKKLKNLVKKNGFSKDLKRKAAVEL